MSAVTVLVKTAQGSGHLELREVHVRAPGPGEVRVRVAAAGICGTDLHIADGEWPVAPPVVVGHEMSGTVVELGDGVDPSWRAARVVTEVFVHADGTCDMCLGGHRNLCPNRRSIGSKVDGAFAEEIILPVAHLHVVPPSLSLREAALVEPLACVVGGLLHPSRVAPGDRVLVTGPGAVGLFAAQVARAAGGDVTLLGAARDRPRLQVAEQLGIRTALVPDVDCMPPESFDVVVECSGAGAAMGTGLAAVTRQGSYVQLGIAGRPVQIDIDQIILKQIAVTSSFGATPLGIRSALRLVERGFVELRPMISGVGTLQDWEALFAQTRTGEGLKFLIEPNGES